MISFSKKEEKKPFTYSSIEMRKSSSGKVWWALGIILLLIVVSLFMIR